MLLRILACIMAPFIVLFAGLSPEYTWAIPLCIGSILIEIILIGADYSEQKLLNRN